MRRFIFARARHAVVVVIAAGTLAFVLAHLAPGDPFYALDDTKLSQADHAALNARFGYDQPLWKQYVMWAGNFAVGDLGWSHGRGRSVNKVLREAIPNTVLLLVPSLVLGLVGGVALGAWQAAKDRTRAAKLTGGLTLALISMPDALVALGVSLVFSTKLKLAPTSGMTDDVLHDTMSFAQQVGDVLAHMVLPCATLAVLIAAVVSRYERTAMLGVLQEDFMRTARAGGATERRAFMHHAIRNSLGPVLALAGLLVPAMLAGTVFVERVYGWPGLGSALVRAVSGRDYAVAQAIVLLGTVVASITIAASDVLAQAANPRLRLDA